MAKQPEESRLGRGIYLLPNLFTMTALFGGFYAVVAAMKGHFDHAAIAIYLAMIMDYLDGLVARLTNTQTAFGAEFDSLSDMVSFGVAPALVVYSWSLHYLGKIGWLVAFIYAVAVALRLARFNVRSDKNDKKYFRGLPSPSAAGLIAGLVWIGDEYQIDGSMISIVVGVMTLLAGLLLVSNLRYRSFKDVDLKGKVPFIAIIVLLMVFVLILIDPPEVLFATFFIYALSGPVTTVWKFRKKKRSSRLPKKKSK